MEANCTKDGVVVDFSSNEKAKQCLAGEDLLVERCNSENVVCLLMVDSKGKIFGVGEVIDVVRFGNLLRETFASDYLCLSVCCSFEITEKR